MASAADFYQALLALLPPGKVWTRRADALISKVLNGIAPEFARLQARADQLLVEFVPTTAVEMLDEWEAIYGLPDPCVSPVPATTEERQAALATRFLEFAGHNTADYIAVAEALGATDVQIVRRPYEPFVAGKGAAGDPGYGEGWAFAYLVQYMDDQIADPDDVTVWVADVGTSTIDPNAAHGPTGALRAERINFTSATARRSYAVVNAQVPAYETHFELWLKSEAGLVPVEIKLEGTTANEVLAVEVDVVWQRFVVRFQSDSATVTASIGVNGTGPSSVLVAGARVANADASIECKLDDMKQAHTVAEFAVKDLLLPGIEYQVVASGGELVVDSGGDQVTVIL